MDDFLGETRDFLTGDINFVTTQEVNTRFEECAHPLIGHFSFCNWTLDDDDDRNRFDDNIK